MDDHRPSHASRTAKSRSSASTDFVPPDSRISNTPRRYYPFPYVSHSRAPRCSRVRRPAVWFPIDRVASIRNVCLLPSQRACIISQAFCISFTALLASWPVGFVASSTVMCLVWWDASGGASGRREMRPVLPTPLNLPCVFFEAAITNAQCILSRTTWGYRRSACC